MIRKEIIDERVVRDLRKHMEQKFITAIEDYVDRCLVSEIDYHLSASELMTSLIRLTTWYAVRQFDIPAEEFAKVLADEFARAMKRRAAKENDR